MRVGEIVSRINDAVKIRLFINDTLIGLVVNVCVVLFFIRFNADFFIGS
nr:hypothetical protein [Nitritalea halalkaliphila]